MTTILGIHPGHDAGAALIRDGKILAAVDEERFTRKKHWGGGYPENSVKFVLDYCRLSLDDVDAIAIPSKKFSKSELIRLGLRYAKYPFILFNRMRKTKNKELGYAYHSGVVKNGLKKHFGKIKPIIGVDHHMAHAAAAYYTSGFENPVIITLDGVGGAVSGTVNIIKNRKIKRISSTLEPGSLGHFYEALTEATGFLVNNGEYKVMGMAAYGKWEKAYRELKTLSPKVRGLKFTRKKPWKIYSIYSNNFWNVHLAESALAKVLADKYGKINLAASGQRILEDLIIRWIKNIIKRTGKREICAAGGVFLNVKANKRIRDELGVDLWVFPHAGDGGLSVGCGLYVNALLNPGQKFEKLKNLSLGPEYSNKEIERELKKYKEIKYKKVKNISKTAADYAVRGKIVGWFQGRMEYGPRALGNRSIITNPSKKEYKDKVNIEVKFREEWRPFCPSMTEKGKRYLINPEDAWFMITSFKVPKNKQKEIEGVVHIDGTTRPQIVEKKTNKKYWEMINNVDKKIKIPVVLNTSFNRKGEPIVCSPKDALNTFLNCGMEYLAIGDFIVEKKKNYKKFQQVSLR
jgi:carbamoyltransferase